MENGNLKNGKSCATYKVWAIAISLAATDAITRALCAQTTAFRLQTTA